MVKTETEEKEWKQSFVEYAFLDYINAFYYI